MIYPESGIVGGKICLGLHVYSIILLNLPRPENIDFKSKLVVQGDY